MKLIIKLMLVLLLVLFTIVTVHSATLKGGYVVCLSESLFDEITKSVVNNDTTAWNYLIKNGCLIAKAGIRVSVIENSWGTVKIRAYSSDSSFILWTYIENIVDDNL